MSAQYEFLRDMLASLQVCRYLIMDILSLSVHRINKVTMELERMFYLHRHITPAIIGHVRNRWVGQDLHMSRKQIEASGKRDGAVTKRGAVGGHSVSLGAAEPFELERHVFYWMTQVVSRRDRQINAELRRFRLRVPEWRVLGILRARQRLSLGEAAAMVGLEHATMSRTVDRLVKAGRILRVSDAADRRETRLAITAEGTRLFDQVWPMVSRLNDIACARLPEGSRPLLCHALSEMVRSLEDSLRDRGDVGSTGGAAG